MAASLILSPLSGLTISENRSTFLSSPKFSFVHSRRPKRYSYRSLVVAMCYDHMPKKFRHENLEPGLRENYKDASRLIYGLTPSQMNMFMSNDSALRLQSESVTEESISARYSYLNNSGMRNMTTKGSLSMSMSMSTGTHRRRGGGRRGRRSPPPDLPSLILDNRVVWLGMPLVPAVTQLILAEIMWLDFVDNTKPIHLYLNCTGTQNRNKEIVGAETNASAIADAMELTKADVYTLNFCVASGQAAMLLSLGKKGQRAVTRHASTILYLPSGTKSSGVAADMWLRAKELDANTAVFLKFLSKGTGKPIEELRHYLRGRRFFLPEKAIEFGIVDKIINKEKQNYTVPVNQRKMKALPQSGAGDEADPWA